MKDCVIVCELEKKMPKQERLKATNTGKIYWLLLSIQ